MKQDYDALIEARDAVRRRDARVPAVALVLGSGLGGFADRLADAVKIPYQDLPHFPRSSVSGHAGNLVLGSLGAVPVVAMQGRVHGYEGFSPAQVVFPVRVMGLLGARVLLVTNAAGGLEPSFLPGDLMVISDQINATATSPLLGPNDERLGPRFPDMSAAYDPGLVARLHAAAVAEGLALRQGVYVGVSGPSYETAAEVRMYRALGGHAVGMSTVHEVIAAAHQGLRVAGLSCITNQATGIGSEPLSHAEVEQVAARSRQVFTRLLAAAIPLLSRN